MNDQLGVYISVPFCRAKCTYCNFASGVFGAERMNAYVERVCAEITASPPAAAAMGAALPRQADTIFLGGGTPSLLSAHQMGNLFASLRAEFGIAAGAEVTLECAPGQLSAATLEAMLRLGMNRISFGVQSFIDSEAKAVGRLHTRAMCLAEIDRLRASGLSNINLDLIAGLPGQTAQSWRESVEVAILSGVPHISVYMLEVDEDSRLGREMLQSGARYGACTTPGEDETADWYAAACDWLQGAAIQQYEISNFSRPGYESRHNVKYWRREPYIGFGLDAHSMLRADRHSPARTALRWSNTGNLDEYLAPASAAAPPGSGGQLPMLMPRTHPVQPERIGVEQAFEETLFLGLRMNIGISLSDLRADFGPALLDSTVESMREMRNAGMLLIDGDRAKLTPRGRMASNEVFSRLLITA